MSQILQLTRTEGWRQRLFDFLDQHKHQRFAYGEDCVLGFAVGIVKAISGVDPLSVAGEQTYTDLEGARQALSAQGAATIGDLLAKYLPEIPVVRATIGDLGVVETDGDFGDAVCMFDSSGIVVCTTEGQGRLRRTRAVRAFQVGERIE